MAGEKKTLTDVRVYWEKAARVELDEENLRPSARDPYLQTVVEDAIAKWLYRDANLLDIGCGDGLSTLNFARHVKRAIGLDYIEDYVEKARSNAAKLGVSNVEFEAGNVLDLSQFRIQRGKFDIVSTIRCLINLVSWTNQARAVAEIASCVRPGGIYLTSEGWHEGMCGLNLCRQRIGLKPIEVVEYNLMLSRADFEREAQKYFEIIDYVGLGFYIYMSRVFQPIFVSPDAPQHRHPINKVAADLQANSVNRDEFLDCDYAGVYVLRRRQQ